MNEKELFKVLELHKKWLESEDDGVYADLQNADLQNAKLQNANLQRANLQNADLQGADLRYAKLQNADLQRANLQYADLQGADLQRANLQYADLQGADLQGANLDFNCLPLWCGGQFKADERICKQVMAHALRICELSGVGNRTLHKVVGRFVKGWHREDEFNARKDV